MQYYRPARGRRVVNKKRMILFGVVIAAAIAVVIFCAYMFSAVTLTPEKEQELFAEGTFQEGVSVGGQDVSGLTFAQGEAKVQPVAEAMLNDNKIEYKVKDQTYTYTLTDSGVSVDAQTPLKEAMLYGREGTRWDLTFGSAEPKDFPVDYQFDETKLYALVDADSAAWGEEAVDASYGVEKQSDKDDLTTGGTLVKTEPKDGWKVDPAAIKQTAKQQIETQTFSPFEAQIEVIEGSKDAPQGELKLMGTATTTIGSSSSKGRKFNIWMISDKLNGAVFKPGETFSVNDYVGDRTEKLGWALAPGIENGTYTDQAGGGICQVSSTMYNAALKAEMKIVARVPHTIMAGYTPEGMDATISTGGPDFKVMNKLESDMVMIVKCNIPDMKVTVEIYGPETRDYYLKFTPEKTSEQPLPETQFKTNPALEKFEVKRTKVGQKGDQYTIYAQKYDKQTDKSIGERYEVTTSTYDPIAPVVEVGSGVVGIPQGATYEDVVALAAQLKAEEEAKNNPQPSPPPSSVPTTTPDPVTDPDLKPEEGA